ncbi:hypothetical protein [Desulfospira joergensenii]|uniref:hypothetical protein n=1 Tax=Desulfospira joergensenii TaxID=53329 RepID=UPI0004215D2F|nr:hypothetical protein [Desulfospira joergensenii]
MKSGIYTLEKCRLCGKSLKFNERKELVICPSHKNETDSGFCFVRFGAAVNKTFSNAKEALQFLYGLRFKTVRLLDHHIETFQELKKQFLALPDIPFFRLHGGIQSVQPNQSFGQKYFKKWWDRACDELGVQGFDLYDGTRHTTTTKIDRRTGSDNARKASAHETNKVFDRYCQFQDDTSFEMAKK